MRKTAVSIVVTLTALILFHSASAAAREQTPNTRYLSPLDNFSVPIPEGAAQRVQVDSDRNGGNVSFHNAFGSLRSIFYLRLSPETQKVQNDPERQRENLARFLSDYAMRQVIGPRFPGANILHQEHLTIDDSNAYFAIVAIPGGSMMFDEKAGKRYDTKRGVLIFVKDKFIYMLSSGENPKAVDLRQPAKSLEKLTEQEKRSLLSFKSGMTFR